jgi:hypothetical protein
MARDSNDESKNPWAGVRYQSGVPGFQEIHRGVQLEYKMPNKWDTSEPFYVPKDDKADVGQHWTYSKHIASGFSERGETGDYPQSKRGRVYTGLVHDKDIWDYDEPGALEHFNKNSIYHPDSDESGWDYGEQEATVKKGSPILMTNINEFDVDKDSGLRSEKKFDKPEIYRVK